MSESWGWERLFVEIQQFIAEADSHLGRASESYALYVVERMEVCLSNLRHLKECMTDFEEEIFSEEEIGVISTYKEDVVRLVSCLESIAILWRNYYDDLLQLGSVAITAYQVPSSPPLPHARGRPQYVISQDQLEYLHSLGFKWTEISALLGVSRMTLYRRRREYGMLEDSTRPISNSELRQMLRLMRQQHPNFGETMAMGYIRSLGYKVRRARLREAIHATDPIQVALRWQGNLASRRPYSVPGPNSLWHIGKLVEWERCRV